MPETAVAVAPEENLADGVAEQAPEAEAKPQMTREQAVEYVLGHQIKSFEQNDIKQRIQIALRKGIITENPSIEYTLEELKALVPLPHDRWNYDWVNEEKGTRGVVAKNAHGLLAVPKQRGRRKKHMTKHQQDIKSTSLSIFKQLFAAKAERLKAVCKTEEIEYLGVPDSALPELGKQAAMQALTAVKDKAKRKRDKARRRQKYSRAVNAGIFGMNNPGERNFVEHGGQFGS
jgi:hypothetical protein